MNILYWKTISVPADSRLYSHFLLVLAPPSHSETKQCYAEREQSCHNHRPGHSIFRFTNHNTCKEHNGRWTFMPNFGNFKAAWLEPSLLLVFSNSPHWPQSCSGIIPMPCSHFGFCTSAVTIYVNVFLVIMSQNESFFILSFSQGLGQFLAHNGQWICKNEK